MKRRTPQEKKRLSYLKDRRNFYGENDKATRKNLPRKRQRQHRSERHRAAQTLGKARGAPDPQIEDAVETRLAGDRKRVRAPKSPDQRLGDFVPWKLRKRVDRGNAEPEQAEERVGRIRRRLRR